MLHNTSISNIREAVRVCGYYFLMFVIVATIFIISIFIVLKASRIRVSLIIWVTLIICTKRFIVYSAMPVITNIPQPQ